MMEQRGELMYQSSMTHWWPRLQSTDVTVPETIKVGGSEQPVGDGSMSTLVPNTDEVADAVDRLGGLPVFFRSDQTSCKFDMLNGSKIETTDPDEMKFGGLVEAHFGFGAPDPTCFYAREWLDLWHRFKSFSDSATPVAAEVRVFILDGDVYDAGFYWPPDSPWDHASTEDNWPTLLGETKQRALADETKWMAMSRHVAAEFDDGYWSVDFALTEGGKWYCIDMARGEVSWHPDNIEKPFNGDSE